jgi:hypothetical protein
MSRGMRIAINPPFKHWWLVGGLLLCGMAVAGWWTGWSGGFLTVTAIVAAIYVGLPPMEAARQQMRDNKGTSRTVTQKTVNVNGNSAGGAMVWDTRISPVAHALSQAISDKIIIRDIAVKSGISLAFVWDTPDASSYWTSVLDRAQDEGDQRVDAVLQEALTRTQNTKVHEAIKAYWEACGRQ